MTTAQHQIPDYTTDDAATYKAKLDGNAAVVARIGAAYQAYANSTPNMTVKVAAGALLVAGAVVENAIQTTGTITAPGSNSRIDRVVIDATTGVVSVITGTSGVSPTAPALTAGKLPVAQVLLTSASTAITNSMITDERAISAGLTASQLQTIGGSVASNALTVTAGTLDLDFRSTTLGSGTITRVSGSPANLVVPSGATLGTINSTQSDIAVLALNNAGTIELAVVNLAGGVQIDETNLVSTTAISAGSTSAGVVYSTTARTNVAYRVIGIIRSTQSTSGTWATAPSLVQGAGGNALNAMQSIGYGQTWQDVLGSRTSATTYYNTTGKPILVSVTTGGSGTSVCTVNGVTVINQAGSLQAQNSFIVPPGQSYVVTNASIQAWAELR